MDAAPAPLVAIAGPTGSGKSELALELAEEFDGEIVNCDSLQLYRYLDIGTAKVPVSERRGIPHHLLDVLNPDEVFTAGEYSRRARAVIADITARGRLPLVVGGTGFYLRALIDGLFPAPPRDERLRTRLAEREAKRPGALHRLLRRLDPGSVGRIHAGDLQKAIRALEVRLLTGKPMTEWFATARDALGGYRTLKLALNPPREKLYERLDARCAAMFETGLAGEVRRVLDFGFPPDSKALEAHGYRQAVELLAGRMELPEAVCSAQRNTRRYAKRQWTWFRGEPGLVWIDGFGGDSDVQRKAAEIVRNFLSEIQE